MIKKNLTPRQRYVLAYRRFRQHGEDWDFLYMYDSANEPVNAAEYAYQAKNHVVTGWLSRRRYIAFLNRQAELSGELPY